jgi:hypothetical protein
MAALERAWRGWNDGARQGQGALCGRSAVIPPGDEFLAQYFFSPNRPAPPILSVLPQIPTRATPRPVLAWAGFPV